MNLSIEQVEAMEQAAKDGLLRFVTVNLDSYKARCRDILALAEEVRSSTVLMVEMNRRLCEHDPEWAGAHGIVAEADEQRKAARKQRRWVQVDEDGNVRSAYGDTWTTRQKNASLPLPAGLRWQEVSDDA